MREAEQPAREGADGAGLSDGKAGGERGPRASGPLLCLPKQLDLGVRGSHQGGAQRPGEAGASPVIQKVHPGARDLGISQTTCGDRTLGSAVSQPHGVSSISRKSSLLKGSPEPNYSWLLL